MKRSAVLALAFAVSAAAVAGVLSGAAGAIRIEQLAAAAAVAVLGFLAIRQPGPPLPVADQAAEAGRRQWSSLYQLESTVMIGAQSPHHYDLGLRPRLQRVLSALAASRRGLDLAERPEEARRLVGEELWPLIDPARPASRDSRPGGVDLDRLERLLDRIERL